MPFNSPAGRIARNSPRASPALRRYDQPGPLALAGPVIAIETDVMASRAADGAMLPVNEKKIEVGHEGAMRFVGRTPSGHEMVFDDSAGDSGARPTEGLLAALAACTAMDVVSIMDKKRQQYRSYTVHVSGVQRDEYPQVFTRIDLVHEVVGDDVETAQVRRCIELSALKYCPVNAMLSAGDTEVHHRYRVIRLPAGAKSTSQARDAEETGEVVVTGPHWRPAIVEG